MLGVNLGQRALMICVSWIILSRAQFIKPWLKDTSLSLSLSASPWSAQGLRGALRLRCMSWPGALFTPRLVFGYSDELLTVAFHCQILHPPFTSPLSRPPILVPTRRHIFEGEKLKPKVETVQHLPQIGFRNRLAIFKALSRFKMFRNFLSTPEQPPATPPSTYPLDSLSCKQHACLGFLSHLIAFLLVFYSLLVLLCVCVCGCFSVWVLFATTRVLCVCLCEYMCVGVCVCRFGSKLASSGLVAMLARFHCEGEEGSMAGEERGSKGGRRKESGGALSWAYARLQLCTHTQGRAEMRATKDTLVALCKWLACSIATRCLPLTYSISLPIPRYLAELGVKWNGKW